VSETNYPEVQLQEQVWEHIWWAQTFTPLETHDIEFVTLKLEAPLSIEGVIVSIQYAPGDVPIGIDLVKASITYAILKKPPVNKPILFRFPTPFHLVQGIKYAHVIRTIPMWALRPCLFTYEALPGHYPRGKLIKSVNSGNTWSPADRGDMFFGEWGHPPVKPSKPPPPLINFAIPDIEYFHQPHSIRIKTSTNVPCHLTCYYTDKEPWKHHTSRTIRGLKVPWRTYFCFVAWNMVEQSEYGATLYHTFELPFWEYCQTKWFTFRGTVDDVESPSVGPIFKHHHSGVLPFTFSIGSEAINRPGQFGNVVGVYRYLIELANPSTLNTVIRQVNAYFSTVSPSKWGFLITFQETSPGIFSSRDFTFVSFPNTLGVHTWDFLNLNVKIGDFIGIGLPVAIGAPDYGIDVTSAIGAGVRHNQAGLTLPIINEPFRIYPTSIMSLEGKG